MPALGIETSCDETAAAVVTDEKQILSNVILSQIDEHQCYGGVVPEVAARSHIAHINDVISQALTQASVKLPDVDIIAVTGGPGLIGGVIVGVMTAKALASVHSKPFIAVNHLEGHALTVRLTHDIAFPYLLLLASGGHCQFLVVHDVGKYTRLGATMDDALGEAFDKTAKMMGLAYPGGPTIERLAKSGNEMRYAFPIPLKGRPDCNFSFSGLKTAVRKQILDIQEKQPLTEQEKADVCASFQYTATQCVLDRASNAIGQFKQHYPNAQNFVLAGGVAANQYIRQHLKTLLEQHEMNLIAPPVKLCTDNAAMIAWAGIENYKAGNISNLAFEPRARWPLAAAN